MTSKNPPKKLSTEVKVVYRCHHNSVIKVHRSTSAEDRKAIQREAREEDCPYCRRINGRRLFVAKQNRSYTD